MSAPTVSRFTRSDRSEAESAGPRMEDRHLQVLSEIAFRLLGFELDEVKRGLVEVRVLRRIRQLRLGSFDAYCELLQAPGSTETMEFVDAITTNVTSFFREPHHFDLLAEDVIPRALTSTGSSGSRLRIWSAGCSSGQEAFSIAATVASSCGPGQFLDCKILATDVDSGSLERARLARYSASDRQAINDRPGASRWFEEAPDGGIRPKSQLRDMVYVRSLNLIGEWPMSGPIDVIFCRNVTIYFSPDTQRQLFLRMAEILGPGGVLITGHSETMPRNLEQFTAVGHTAYRVVGRSGLEE